MPLGKYKNFAACKKAKTPKIGAKGADKYCGKLYWKTHGKKEGMAKLKHEIELLKEKYKGK